LIQYFHEDFKNKGTILLGLYRFLLAESWCGTPTVVFEGLSVAQKLQYLTVYRYI